MTVVAMWHFSWNWLGLSQLENITGDKDRMWSFLVFYSIVYTVSGKKVNESNRNVKYDIYLLTWSLMFLRQSLSTAAFHRARHWALRSSSPTPRSLMKFLTSISCTIIALPTTRRHMSTFHDRTRQLQHNYTELHCWRCKLVWCSETATEPI